MKITIDTTNKTIKVEESVNIDDLNAELKKMLGDKVSEYRLLPVEFIWNSYPVPAYPYTQPYIQPYYGTIPATWPTVVCAADITSVNVPYTLTTATCQ